MAKQKDPSKKIQQVRDSISGLGGEQVSNYREIEIILKSIEDLYKKEILSLEKTNSLLREFPNDLKEYRKALKYTIDDVKSLNKALGDVKRNTKALGELKSISSENTKSQKEFNREVKKSKSDLEETLGISESLSKSLSLGASSLKSISSGAKKGTQEFSGMGEEINKIMKILEKEDRFSGISQRWGKDFSKIQDSINSFTKSSIENFGNLTEEHFDSFRENLESIDEELKETLDTMEDHNDQLDMQNRSLEEKIKKELKSKKANQESLEVVKNLLILKGDSNDLSEEETKELQKHLKIVGEENSLMLKNIVRQKEKIDFQRQQVQAKREEIKAERELSEHQKKALMDSQKVSPLMEKAYSFIPEPLRKILGDSGDMKKGMAKSIMSKSRKAQGSEQTTMSQKALESIKGGGLSKSISVFSGSVGKFLGGALKFAGPVAAAAGLFWAGAKTIYNWSKEFQAKYTGLAKDFGSSFEESRKYYKEGMKEVEKLSQQMGIYDKESLDVFYKTMSQSYGSLTNFLNKISPDGKDRDLKTAQLFAVTKAMSLVTGQSIDVISKNIAETQKLGLSIQESASVQNMLLSVSKETGIAYQVLSEDLTKNSQSVIRTSGMNFKQVIKLSTLMTGIGKSLSDYLTRTEATSDVMSTMENMMELSAMAQVAGLKGVDPILNELTSLLWSSDRDSIENQKRIEELYTKLGKGIESVSDDTLRSQLLKQAQSLGLDLASNVAAEALKVPEDKLMSSITNLDTNLNKNLSDLNKTFNEVIKQLPEEIRRSIEAASKLAGYGRTAERFGESLKEGTTEFIFGLPGENSYSAKKSREIKKAQEQTKKRQMDPNYLGQKEGESWAESRNRAERIKQEQTKKRQMDPNYMGQREGESWTQYQNRIRKKREEQRSKNPIRKNTGGIIPGGSGVRDDVPAVLTGGEYVVNKDAAKSFGYNNLDHLNRKDFSKVLERVASSVPGGLKGERFNISGKVHPGLVLLADIVKSGVKDFSKFTAFNDTFHQEKSPKSLHNSGLAMDFTLQGRTISNRVSRFFHSKAQEASDQINKAFEINGIGTIPRVLDEYTKPSEKATGGHFHVDLRNKKTADKVESILKKKYGISENNLSSKIPSLGYKSKKNEESGGGNNIKNALMENSKGLFKRLEEKITYYKDLPEERYFLGGLVKGKSKSIDGIKSRLTDGEYVIKKQIVDKIGKDVLDRLNAGDFSSFFKMAMGKSPETMIQGQIQSGLSQVLSMGSGGGFMGKLLTNMTPLLASQVPKISSEVSKFLTSTVSSVFKDRKSSKSQVVEPLPSKIPDKIPLPGMPSGNITQTVMDSDRKAKEMQAGEKTVADNSEMKGYFRQLIQGVSQLGNRPVDVVFDSQNMRNLGNQIKSSVFNLARS